MPGAHPRLIRQAKAAPSSPSEFDEFGGSHEGSGASAVVRRPHAIPQTSTPTTSATSTRCLPEPLP